MSEEEFKPKKPAIESLTKPIESLNRLVGSPFKMSIKGNNSFPGTTPGIESFKDVNISPLLGTIGIQCIDYDRSQANYQEFSDIESLLNSERPGPEAFRWINIDGLNAYVVNKLKSAYNFHTLAAEDTLQTQQKPKMDVYDDHSIIVADMARIKDSSIVREQISIIIKSNTIITFQERPGDVWEPVRERIKNANSRFRKLGIWYLGYALLDAIVDNFFPVLEEYGTMLNELEEKALNKPSPEIQKSIYLAKRELFGLRRSMWPMRELIHRLTTHGASPIPKKIIPYMRDVHDHSIQIIDLIETYREMTSSLQDLYMSSVAQRMNEIIKVLTILSSLFIPITFVAGVYGMNFANIPELDWKYGYTTFWIVCSSIVGTLLFFFKRNGWLGK